MWEARLDLDLASCCTEHAEKPQTSFILSSQEALALLLMVHLVKMLLPCLFFFSSPSSHSPPPSPHPCSPRLCSHPPHPLTPMYCLFTSCCVQFTRRVCVVFFFLLQNQEVRMYECPLYACCDVIDCHSHYHSESEPAVGTPPPSALQQHQPRAAACSGCWYYWEEEEEEMRNGGCSDQYCLPG